MWRPPLNFVTLHYAYIIFMSLLAIPSLLPEGNMSAVDACFFGASATTESGLNTIDVKDLRTYQQLYVYFIPMITNLGFVNIIVIIVRLYWFNKKFKTVAPTILKAKRRRGAGDDHDVEAGLKNQRSVTEATGTSLDPTLFRKNTNQGEDVEDKAWITDASHVNGDKAGPLETNDDTGKPRTRITFDPSADNHPRNDATLYIPGPRERDHGHPLIELKKDLSSSKDDLRIQRVDSIGPSNIRRRFFDTPPITQPKSFDRVATVASSVFVIGSESNTRRDRRLSTSSQQPAFNDMPFLSEQVTIGRNSQFYNLTKSDREELGGIEYRALKLLLKIVVSYFFGLHLFGAIGLVGWIQYADPKYRLYLEECGQGKNWWAFYSAQTMVDNLGLTLTPDSMITFRDAAWPMFLMSFLAFAGNTLYPVFLRLTIWAIAKLSPRHSSIQEPLSFLLNHPRRCYTLLFPSGTTWALFGIIFALNFVDTLLIVVLDLHNPQATPLPVGPRILAAIFQAASSRHTGTSTFSLADVNPAVQLSLLVMMYISVFPISIAIRASNTYEEKSLGVYETEGAYDEQKGTAYLMKHMQNQLSFDLWYIFLGIFCIACAESEKVMDPKEPAFAMFPIFFEVTSAYGNVGLSLGYPTASTSLSGQFNTFSKIVICAMMIRGRHRGLPYQLDRAIMLPDEHLVDDSTEDSSRQ